MAAVVLIDVSNICRKHDKWQKYDEAQALAAGKPLPPPPGERKGTAELERYILVKKAAQQHFGHGTKVRGWADNSLFQLLSRADRELHRRLVTRKEISVAGEADDPLLEEAELLGAVIISHDNYRGKRGSAGHHWLDGTTDRVYEPVIVGEGTRKRVKLAARSIVLVSDSSARRAAKADQVKANQLSDDDVAWDYRCTSQGCLHSARPKLNVLPVKTSKSAPLVCPSCARPVERLGPREQELQLWTNRKEQRKARELRDRQLQEQAAQLGLPSLNAIPMTGALGTPAPVAPAPAASVAGTAASIAPPPVSSGVHPAVSLPETTWGIAAEAPPAVTDFGMPGAHPRLAVARPVTPAVAQQAAKADPLAVFAPSTAHAEPAGLPAPALEVVVEAPGGQVHSETSGPGEIVLGRMRVLVERGPDGALNLDISRPLGRDADEVSRRHLVIRLSDQGQVTLLDGSVNGVWLDNRRMPADTLVPWTGQRIALAEGRIGVRLQLRGADAGANPHGGPAR
ncbi:FHA domain-containing protein [Streptomyces sp. NPDC002250]|uniref:FHA domain-containing protein n=1 Tax=Streptomyces sp. NPDC002250 TaxID=3364641 RepID=UPI003673D28E